VVQGTRVTTKEIFPGVVKWGRDTVGASKEVKRGDFRRIILPNVEKTAMSKTDYSTKVSANGIINPRAKSSIEVTLVLL
jgi:hypothetical protein